MNFKTNVMQHMQAVGEFRSYLATLIKDPKDNPLNIVSTWYIRVAPNQSALDEIDDFLSFVQDIMVVRQGLATTEVLHKPIGQNSLRDRNDDKYLDIYHINLVMTEKGHRIYEAVANALKFHIYYDLEKFEFDHERTQSELKEYFKQELIDLDFIDEVTKFSDDYAWARKAAMVEKLRRQPTSNGYLLVE